MRLKPVSFGRPTDVDVYVDDWDRKPTVSVSGRMICSVPENEVIGFWIA